MWHHTCDWPPMASISSKKIRQAFLVRAISKSSRTILAPCEPQPQSESAFNVITVWSLQLRPLPPHSPLPHTSAPTLTRWPWWSRRRFCWPRRGHTGSSLCREAQRAAHPSGVRCPGWQTSQALEETQSRHCHSSLTVECSGSHYGVIVFNLGLCLHSE